MTNLPRIPNAIDRWRTTIETLDTITQVAPEEPKPDPEIDTEKGERSDA